LIWLAIAAVGAGLGWVTYWAQALGLIIGTGTGTTGPEVLAAPCIPPSNVLIPLDPATGVESLVGGALLALGLSAVIWLLVLEVSERRKVH
jgi:hypothetical protein